MNKSILFTKEECDRIINISNVISYNRTDGWYPNNSSVNYTDWSIISNEENKWIFDKLIQFYNQFNLEELKTPPPIIHLHKYLVNDKFERHQDIAKNRKYAVGIILNDNYLGGDYILEMNNKEIEIEKKVGNTYMFSSEIWHRITPIISGIRWSCVMFIEEKHLKYKQKSII